MDSAFWDLNVSSPHTLEGSAKAIPGDPFPLDGARASRALRIQQLSLLGNGFPLGIIPSYSPAAHKDLGSFSLQTLLLRPSTSNWYTLVILYWVCFCLCIPFCMRVSLNWLSMENLKLSSGIELDSDRRIRLYFDGFCFAISCFVDDFFCDQLVKAVFFFPLLLL